ncbi:Dnaj homolog subfamily b member 12 [Phtheirospermum japonicum]|uniref:Dnaj homolog subfamily b member 12 n=1 Tax=Phtheirospermum japonicum TaxID=374723 RepID=A0A830BTN4_9LAMI|nr:Dnaj homolog subfamily b member 12 [Phtheirospermum japonicum]
MECNKDEALRAKSIAESKLEQKDFAGSKKFALKAQNLYPGLDGISQMLTTLDVYISAEKKIGGLTDWYGVLGVGSSADDDAIKRQYRKLALMLHPDKNSSAGAEGAFKLISEAWSLLSDKARRLMYNQTTGFNFKGFQQKAPMTTTGPSPSMAQTARPGPSTHAAWAHARGPSPCTAPRPGPSTESPLSKSTKRKPPAPKAQKKSAKSSPAGPSKAAPAPPVQTVESFWTICGQCRIQYEYHKMFRNTTLLCPTCKTPFVAAEIPRPVTKSKSHKPNPCPPAGQQQQNAEPNPNPSNNSPASPPANNDRGKNVVPEAQKPGAGQPGPNIFTNAAHQRAPPRASASGIDRAANPSPAAKVPKFEEKLKRAVCTESNASDGPDRYSKKRKLDDFKMPNGNLNFGRNFNMPNFGNTGPLGRARDMNPIELRKVLMENARKEILKKLNEPGPEVPVDKPHGNKTAKKDNGQTQKNQKKSNGDSSAANNANEQNAVMMKMMKVPDPDFYDFDQDRTERSFASDDVWAAYDDDDGMPRFYALIHKVISKRPFRLKISWLNSKTTTEFGPSLNWVESGFYKTCGEFRVGKHEVCKFVNAFSQKVKWSKGPRGAVVILPQKGDVWALYRNWSSEWDTRTPDDVIHKYDMVIVVDGFDEAKGEVSVAPLVKVVGYRTVFRPDMGDGAVVRIPKEEVFRFSHQVPHHELAGHEAPDMPRGCVELDPAATPLELLGMATSDENAGPSGGNVETGPVKNETGQGIYYL